VRPSSHVVVGETENGPNYADGRTLGALIFGGSWKG
jgi:hypothetical protein